MVVDDDVSILAYSTALAHQHNARLVRPPRAHTPYPNPLSSLLILVFDVSTTLSVDTAPVEMTVVNSIPAPSRWPSRSLCCASTVPVVVRNDSFGAFRHRRAPFPMSDPRALKVARSELTYTVRRAG